MSSRRRSRHVDLVLSGGGVKGIALVGALEALDAHGLRFVDVAATSAGAIVGSLLVAGYRADELRDLMYASDFSLFLDGLPRWLPAKIGAAWNILRHRGMFSGDAVVDWISGLLAAKGVHTFGDLRRDIPDGDVPYPLRVVASDITEGRMFVIPDDLRRLGVDPDTFPVAWAVRASISIPYLFRPFRLVDDHGREHLLVDGALLSNFPMGVLDHGPQRSRPLLGIRLIKSHAKSAEHWRPKGLLSYLLTMFMAAMANLDNRYLDTHPGVGLISVETGMVPATRFSLSAADKWQLHAAGFVAAAEFLAHWNPTAPTA